MSCDPGSPKISLTDGKADSITFEQATQWLIRILCTPLSAVLSFIGNDLTGEYGYGAAGLSIRRSSSSLLISPKSSPKHANGKHSFRSLVQTKIMNMKCPSCNATITGWYFNYQAYYYSLYESSYLFQYLHYYCPYPSLNIVINAHLCNHICPIGGDSSGQLSISPTLPISSSPLSNRNGTVVPSSEEQRTSKDDDDDDDEARDEVDVERLFDTEMTELHEIKGELADVLKENEELKEALATIQALYLNETSKKTLNQIHGGGTKANASTRRSLM